MKCRGDQHGDYMSKLPQSQGSTEGAKIAAKTKWKKLRLKTLHASEDGQGESFHTHLLQGI